MEGPVGAARYECKRRRADPPNRQPGRYRGFAVFVGSDDERSRNDLLAAHWEGPSLNACGQLAPRQTAALIARAEAFVGHDTGTLHLAAAVDTPIVGIFGARNKPGIWFSDRVRDTFFYNHVSCAGCELVQVEACPHDRICMTTHDPARIVTAVHRALTMRDPADGEDGWTDIRQRQSNKLT